MTALLPLALGQSPAPNPSTPVGNSSAQPAASINLEEAIKRAVSNLPAYATAAGQVRTAELDHAIAKAALLPSAVYNNEFLYTQGGAGLITNPVKAADPALQSTSAPRFIANNAVHEYISQASVTENLGPQQFNAVNKATASLAVARAELEVARRGLVSAVVGLYYASATAANRVAISQRAVDEAASLTKLTQQREAAREVAHADVIKAQLQQQQRERELMDAKVNAERARLELGVLLFPDPRTPYDLSLPAQPAPVPARADVDAALAKNNPELKSALSQVRVADLGVTSARLGYLPQVSLNYSYGIDAAQLAFNNDLGNQNLGYSASATLNIPLWDWFTTRDKIRQSEVTRQVARVTLTNTQRKLIATLEETYTEATAAHDQLASLEQSVATAAESLRLVRMRYAAGEATILEVVDAENSLTTTETAREDGLVRYETALAQLQTLTGTLQQ